MKILFVDDCLDLVGGVERTINTLANKLSKDNEVTLLNINKRTNKSFYNYKENIKKKYIFNRLDDKSNKSKNKFVKLLLRIFEYLNRKRTTKKSFNRELKNNEYDVIVFGRVSIALKYLKIIKSYNNNSKVIVRDAIHFYFLKKYEKNKMKKLFPKYVNAFIISSTESANVYKPFFNNDKIKMEKIFNPIGIKPTVKYNYDSKTILSIGRMDDNQKGYDNLIKAMIIVHDKHPDWKLNIFGDGKCKDEYLKIISDNNANNYINIYNSTKNVVGEFNNSSIFVLASRYEGYANILVESLSCGIPSVTYNWLMGADEIIDDNKNGTIVQLVDRNKYFKGKSLKEDCINLSNAICYLIENKKKCDEFHNNSPRIIESRLQDVIIDKWIKIIMEDKNETY